MRKTTLSTRIPDPFSSHPPSSKSHLVLSMNTKWHLLCNISLASAASPSHVIDISQDMQITTWDLKLSGFSIAANNSLKIAARALLETFPVKDNMLRHIFGKPCPGFRIENLGTDEVGI
jgi:hypothetical protein